MAINFKSGRVLEIGGGGDEVIGIGADLEVTEGYDHFLSLWPPDSADEKDWWLDEPPLTAAEKVEICDVMIDRWQRLKTQLGAA